MRKYHLHKFRNILSFFLSIILILTVSLTTLIFLIGFPFGTWFNVPLNASDRVEKAAGSGDSPPVISFKINFKEALGNFLSSKNILVSGQTISSGVAPVSPIFQGSPGEFQWPVKGLLTQNYASYHKAIDIAQKYGSGLKPIEAGRVEKALMHNGLLGNTVVVSHGGGYTSLYAHMDKIYVSAGEAVSKETVIGTIGLTGRTTGPHVHLEVYKDGVAINPRILLP